MSLYQSLNQTKCPIVGYPTFCSPNPPVPCIKFTGTHLNIWAERGIVKLNCLAKENNNMITLGILSLQPTVGCHISVKLSEALIS